MWIGTHKNPKRLPLGPRGVAIPLTALGDDEATFVEHTDEMTGAHDQWVGTLQTVDKERD